MKFKKSDKRCPESEKEHTFVDGNLENAIRKRRDISELVETAAGKKVANTVDEGIKEIVNCVVHEAEKEVQEYLKKENERKKKNRNRNLILCIICIGVIVVTAYVFEFIQQEFNIQGWGILYSVAVEVVLLILGMLTATPELKRHKKSDETYTEGIFGVSKVLFNAFIRMSILHIIMILWAMVSIGIICAQYDVFEKITSIMNIGYLVVEEEQEDDMAIIDNSPVDKEIKEFLLNSDAKMFVELEKIYIPKKELMYEICLDEEDYAKIFFADEDYGNVNWESQEQVNQVVLQRVEELIEEKNENVFDKKESEGGATQEVRDEVSMASENEKNVSNFADLNEILLTRTIAYSQYPKMSLANLMSNDYHKLALLFALHNGNENTTVYYYGKSISSNFECLKYAENSDESIKDRLKRISQRYADIVYVCPKHKVADQAKKLEIAFKNAENQY